MAPGTGTVGRRQPTGDAATRGLSAQTAPARRSLFPEPAHLGHGGARASPALVAPSAWAGWPARTHDLRDDHHSCRRDLALSVGRALAVDPGGADAGLAARQPAGAGGTGFAHARSRRRPGAFLSGRTPGPLGNSCAHGRACPARRARRPSARVGTRGSGRHALGRPDRHRTGLARIRSGGNCSLPLPGVSLRLGLGDLDRLLGLHAAILGSGDRVPDPAIPAASQCHPAPVGAAGRAREPSRSGGPIPPRVGGGRGCGGSARRARESGGQRDPGG